MFYTRCICSIFALVTHVYASYPSTQVSYQKETITHNGLNTVQCRDSNDCSINEVCEKICFTEQLTEFFVGCKVACVVRSAENKYQGPQTDVHFYPKTPAYGSITKPPTVYGPTSPTSVECKTNYDCGRNAYCQQYTCQCYSGFQPIPSGYNQVASAKNGCQPVPTTTTVGYAAQPAGIYPPPNAGYPDTNQGNKFTCQSLLDCGSYAFCQYGKCTCQQGFVPVQGAYKFDCAKPNLYDTNQAEYPSTPGYGAATANHGTKDIGYPSQSKHCYTNDDCDYSAPYCCTSNFGQRPYVKECKTNCYRQK